MHLDTLSSWRVISSMGHEGPVVVLYGSGVVENLSNALIDFRGLRNARSDTRKFGGMVGSRLI